MTLIINVFIFFGIRNKNNKTTLNLRKIKELTTSKKMVEKKRLK